MNPFFNSNILIDLLFNMNIIMKSVARFNGIFYYFFSK